MKKRLTVSLKTALPSLIVVVIVFLVVNILFFAYQGNKYTAFKITEKLMYQIYSTTTEKLNFYFESSKMSLRDIDLTLKEKKINLESNPQDFLVYLRKVLLSNPSITGAYFGDKSGSFYMAKRMPDKSISFRLIKRKKEGVDVQWVHKNPAYNELYPSKIFSLEEGYDPRLRPWYQDAKETDELIWTDPYIFASDQLLGVSVARSFVSEGVDGVFAVDFGLAEINDFIRKINISEFASLFIIDKRGKVITYSSPDNDVDLMYKEISDDGGKKSLSLLDIPDLKDPVLASLYDLYRESYSKFDDNSSLYENKVFTTIFNFYIELFYDQESLERANQLFQNADSSKTGDVNNGEGGELSKTFYATYGYSDEDYLFMLSDLNITGAFDTKLGIVIPQELVLSYLYYNYQIILFTTIMLVAMSLVIIIIVANRSISLPISMFTRRLSRMVNNFELEPFGSKKTSLTEISNINTSIENVRRALVSFQKYLPKEVVADLIKSGKEATIGGDKKEVTIFFSDIQDFTKISEENPSDVLFEKLEVYFDLVDHCVTKNRGILDKFIGDAVMALWGVPHDIPNHAASACIAAVEINQALEKFNKKLYSEDFPVLNTRIGIHTGIAIVGNIGSENRLNYTCIGDEVNLASRLEALNKFYKTQILVSNITLQYAKEFLEYRMVDRVMVKGKTQRVLVHEVVAKKGELFGNKREFLKNYRKGINFYFEGHWDDAVEAFTIALKFNPDDFVSQCYVEKARSFKNKKIDEIDMADMCLDQRIGR